MKEFMFLGRGGQGVVIAGEIFAEALFREGLNVRAFPSFGTERRGAPVQSFIRVSDANIRSYFKIYEPDFYVIFDESQVKVNLYNKEGVVNASKDYSKSLIACDAKKIAISNNLGSETNPIINTAILGGVYALLEDLNFVNLEKAITSRFQKHLHTSNLQAAYEAFESVKSKIEKVWSIKCA